MKITKAKVTQLILEMIYLQQQLYEAKACDHETLADIEKVIQDLRFWRQFMK